MKCWDNEIASKYVRRIYSKFYSSSSEFQLHFLDHPFQYSLQLKSCLWTDSVLLTNPCSALPRASSTPAGERWAKSWITEKGAWFRKKRKIRKIRLGVMQDTFHIICVTWFRVDCRSWSFTLIPGFNCIRRCIKSLHKL